MNEQEMLTQQSVSQNPYAREMLVNKAYADIEVLNTALADYYAWYAQQQGTDVGYNKAPFTVNDYFHLQKLAEPYGITVPVHPELQKFNLGRAAYNTLYEGLDSVLFGLLPNDYKMPTANPYEETAMIVGGLLGSFLGLPGINAVKAVNALRGLKNTTQLTRLPKIFGGVNKAMQAGEAAQTVAKTARTARKAKQSAQALRHWFAPATKTVGKRTVAKMGQSASLENMLYGGLTAGLGNIAEDLPEGNIEQLLYRSLLGGLLGGILGPVGASRLP